MIAHLRGRLLAKYPQQAIIEAGGVGYDIVISVPTFSALPSEGSEVGLFIHTHVREDTLALYGFLNREEKRVFERLITVSGVGPKLAVTIQSGLSTERLVGAIRGQDHATLSQIPGIGKRLAERLVVDLKDKLEDMAAPPQRVETGPSTEDVLSALVKKQLPQRWPGIRRWRRILRHSSGLRWPECAIEVASDIVQSRAFSQNQASKLSCGILHRSM
jgi:holliday junction DNA helicase RuvA